MYSCINLFTCVLSVCRLFYLSFISHLFYHVFYSNWCPSIAQRSHPPQTLFVCEFSFIYSYIYLFIYFSAHLCIQVLIYSPVYYLSIIHFIYQSQIIYFITYSVPSQKDVIRQSLCLFVCLFVNFLLCIVSDSSISLLIVMCQFMYYSSIIYVFTYWLNYRQSVCQSVGQSVCQSLSDWGINWLIDFTCLFCFGWLLDSSVYLSIKSFVCLSIDQFIYWPPVC